MIHMRAAVAPLNTYAEHLRADTENRNRREILARVVAHLLDQRRDQQLLDQQGALDDLM